MTGLTDRGVSDQARFTAGQEDLAATAIVALEHVGASLTMNQLAAAMGLSKAGLYRHFDSKTELLQVILCVASRSVRAPDSNASRPTSVTEQIGRVILDYLQVVAVYPNVAFFLSFGTDEFDATVTSGNHAVVELIASILRSANRDPTADQHRTAELVAVMVVGAITAAAGWWSRGDKPPFTDDQLTALARSLATTAAAATSTAEETQTARESPGLGPS